MQFQNIIRTQLVIAGLGATLLFAGATKAQEIVNTDFSDGPNVVAFTQSAGAQGTVAANAALPAPQAARAMAAISASANASAPAQQASVDAQPTVDAWLLGTLLACVGAIALYALAIAKRVTRELHSRSNSYVSTPGA